MKESLTLLEKLARKKFKAILAKQKKSKAKGGSFDVSFDEKSFADWFMKQTEKQKDQCFYCRVKQSDITRLIESKKGLLRSKRFVTRGKSLEVERMDSSTNSYSAENCVLICYFCNNDKSDVVSAEDYLTFFAEAKRRYFEYLLGKLED